MILSNFIQPSCKLSMYTSVCISVCIIVYERTNWFSHWNLKHMLYLSQNFVKAHKKSKIFSVTVLIFHIIFIYFVLVFCISFPFMFPFSRNIEDILISHEFKNDFVKSHLTSSKIFLFKSIYINIYHYISH